MTSVLRKRVPCAIAAVALLASGCQTDPTGAGDTGGVEGRTSLGSSIPLAGVDLYLLRGDTLRHQVSDLDGHFAFGDLREGQYWIHMDPPTGYTRPSPESGPIAVGVPSAYTVSLTIVFLNQTPRGSIAVGAVADSAGAGEPDGAAPVAGVTVRLFANGSETSMGERETGNEGLAVFSVDSGTYDVDVVPPPGTAIADGEPTRMSGIRVTEGTTVRPPPFKISITN